MRRQNLLARSAAEAFYEPFKIGIVQRSCDGKRWKPKHPQNIISDFEIAEMPRNNRYRTGVEQQTNELASAIAAKVDVFTPICVVKLAWNMCHLTE